MLNKTVRRVTQDLEENKKLNPEAYRGKHSPWDFIEDHNLNFNLGSALKHIVRTKTKSDKVMELKKAQKYIAREIERLS